MSHAPLRLKKQFQGRILPSIFLPIAGLLVTKPQLRLFQVLFEMGFRFPSRLSHVYCVGDRKFRSFQLSFWLILKEF